MKKTTLIMIASASMLFAVPPAVDTAPMQGQGMKQGKKQMMPKKKCSKPTQGQGMKKCNKQVTPGKKCCKKNDMKKSRKQMNSPFLITRGLPHLSKMIIPYMDDPIFALSVEQKKQLDYVKTETMKAIVKVKPEIVALRQEIITAGKMGTSAELLQKKVAKLAVLQAQATMTQIKCIEETKKVLTKEQLLFLLSQKKRNMKQGKKPMKQNKNKKCNKRQ